MRLIKVNGVFQGEFYQEAFHLQSKGNTLSSADDGDGTQAETAEDWENILPSKRTKTIGEL